MLLYCVKPKRILFLLLGKWILRFAFFDTFLAARECRVIRKRKSVQHIAERFKVIIFRLHIKYNYRRLFEKLLCVNH